MEADWEIEVGGDAPVIDASWSGFVDLRISSDDVKELEQVRQLPGLAEVLVRLNAIASPVWTSKCDVFIPDHLDPDEMAASPERATHALACYIDVLPRGDLRWSSANLAVDACKRICALLRLLPLHDCRTDLVVRRALISPGVPEAMDLGITAYLTGCGPTAVAAKSALRAALDGFADAIVSATSPANAASKLQ